MAQARRTSPAKSKSGKSGGYLAGLVMLLAGMAIGSLATILWQGAQTADGGIGAGIRRIVESARQSQPGDEKNTGAQQAQPASRSTPFDFFTVLPEIEVVTLAIAPAAEIATATQKPSAEGKNAAPATGVSAYMLQAAAYRHHADADRLKATLALSGMVSVIQKVSIQGRGDFFRVRLGPYASYDEMVAAEQPLTQVGIKALRLKVLKAG